jgi:SAM-dependent methyltransferase
MKNIDLWKPTKFNIRKKKLVPSSKVGVTSYRMAYFIGLFYSEQIE